MRWAENIRCLQHKDKIVLANLNNGTWVRTNRSSYQVIQDILESGLGMDEVKFEDESDGKYIMDIIRACCTCKILLEDNQIEEFVNRHISIELTNRCNLHCIHCCVDAGDGETKDLPTESVIQILDKCIAWKPKLLSLSGGEPMIRKDFWEILTYTRNHYSGRIGVSTNATYISEKNAESLCSNADEIDISIDGIDEATCAVVRGKGVFEKVIKSIQMLHAHHFKNISLSMVFSDKNEELKQQFYELNKKLETKPVLRSFAQAGRGEQSRSIFTDGGPDHVSVSKDYLDLENKKPLGARSCSAGKQMCFIRYNGDVYPCPSYMDEQYCLGNILGANSLSELLLEHNHHMAKKLAEKDMLASRKCRDCEVSVFCWTCPGVAYRPKTEQALEKYCNLHKPVLMHKIWGE